ncbi:MAG: helix-turn-helix transcriptional regulator [Clostridia bacterium]|nr:helix-turn-helix transcriptional regulator [Clostridia bacterium]
MKEKVRYEQDNQILSGVGFEIFISYASRKGMCVSNAHMHSAFEFLYILNGSFRIEADGRQEIAQKGDLAVFPPQTIHQIYSQESGETNYLVLKIKPETFLEFAQRDKGISYMFQLSNQQEKNVIAKKELEAYEIAPVLENLLKVYKSPLYGAELCAKSYFMLLFAGLLRMYPEKRIATDNIPFSALQQIYQAVNIINNRYEEDLTAKNVANEVAMSYTYFSRRFKAITGKSFTRYLNEVRINHAEKTLLLTDKSVTEVAYASGFNDVSYFIARYKELRGKTPYKLKTESMDK